MGAAGDGECGRRPKFGDGDTRKDGRRSGDAFHGTLTGKAHATQQPIRTSNAKGVPHTTQRRVAVGGGSWTDGTRAPTESALAH